VAGAGVEALLAVSPAFDELVGPAGDWALTLFGSCAGALLEPAHAADKTAQVKAMMVIFIRTSGVEPADTQGAGQ
jgi:hypothetical protein